MASERVDMIAQQLVGQCQHDLSYFCEEAGFNEDEIASEIDELCFCCEGCGWWVEAGDAHENPDGGDLCGDCCEGCNICDG